MTRSQSEVKDLVSMIQHGNPRLPEIQRPYVRVTFTGRILASSGDFGFGEVTPDGH